VTFYHALPGGWEASGALEGVALSGGDSDVVRLGAGAALSHSVTSWLRGGLSSRYLQYSAAAPVTSQRKLFWDPEMFWSTGVMLEVHTPALDTAGFSAYVRGTPGMALTRERDALAAEWVRQFEAEAGFRVRRRKLSLFFDGSYTRGREGGYTSRGLTIGLEVER
jgi:hypothetical protein